MISLSQARNKQATLQSQASRLIDQFSMQNELSTIGDVEVDGSYAYDLMVKQDVDYHVYVTSYNLEAVADVAKRLTLKPGITKVNIGNWVMERPLKPGVPKGYYLGVNAYFENVLWNFDIWVIKPEDKKDPENFPRGWWKQLTPEQKDAILLLKYNLNEAGRYGNGSIDSYGSADVYRAVMNDRITTIKELDVWRKTHPFY